jgi:transposase
MRILVAIESVDLRKGIDGLTQLCREKLGADPFSGYLFIFRSRRATAIKILAYATYISLLYGFARKITVEPAPVICTQ